MSEDTTKNFDYVENISSLFAELLDLFKRKNADYGNSFEKHGQVGIMIRMHDKFQRFLNISQKQVQLINDESLDDTLKDLIVYSAMLLSMRKKHRTTR
jgi:hypothetical protein